MKEPKKEDDVKKKEEKPEKKCCDKFKEFNQIMGSNTSRQQATSPAATSNNRSRRSKRIMGQLLRKSSADNCSLVIDPVSIEYAQNPNEDPKERPDDFGKQSLDHNEIVIQLRDGEDSIPTKPETGFSGGATHSQAESTKQNADRTASHNSTATAETSLKEVLPQPRDNIAEKRISSVSENNQTFTEDNIHSAICEAAKNSPEAQGIHTADHEISATLNFANLTITKLEPLELAREVPSLNIVHYEPVSFQSEVEMPIVKKTAENGHQENGTDKGMFSVSRVKKVELSEIPLASDICSTPPTEQQSVTPTLPANTSNVVSKSANGSGSVLQRVISITTANQSAKPPSKQNHAYVPEKLHFSAYEKFEGQTLMNWMAQSLQTIDGSVTSSLNENDLSLLTLQYCTNLLGAGVIRQLDTATPGSESFKPNLMYQWTHKAPQAAAPMTPGKLETATAWPHALEKKTSPKSREGESKIPKLMSSTPKARIQLVSSLVTMHDQSQSPLTLLNGTETDHNKVNELKIKMGKCETIHEMFLLIKSFLNEYSMHSSESSSNSGIFNTSLLNGSDTTVFDRSMETTVFNVLQHRATDNAKNQKSPVRSRPVKSRTTPSTPTGRADPKKFRRNLSVESVVSTPSSAASTGCKRCSQLLTSPKKIGSKRMVDKATVMDVDPIEFPKAPETRTIETQTDESPDKSKAETEEAASAPIPIPPPMMMAPPPPPPPNQIVSGPPPPPLPGNFKMLNSLNNGIPAANASSPSSPMPLPPPIALGSGPALRKNAVNPPKPMKPLYWTRIVAPIKSVDVPDGAQSAASSPDEDKDNDQDEDLWNEIDEIQKLDNLDEFTELFSRQGVVPKAKTTAPIPKIKAIKVLDSKRSQNVGIFVRSIHVDFAEIEHAIYHCDTSVVSLETLQHIMEIKASTEELLMIKDAVNNHTEGSPPLDAPENFLLRISQVSCSAERISCIVFQAEFEEQCTMVSRKLMTVKSLCEFLLENDGLKEVFSIILTLGNFMNGGNRQRGQADGFGLEILGKLKDVKSKDPKITLLHFIVKTYIERCRKGGCAISDLVLPIPAPNDVDKSLSIDFEECKLQLKALQTKVEECKKTSEKVIAASAPDCVQPFKEKMEMFIEMASKKIESRYQKLDECQLLFIKTIKFYKFLPKKGVIEDTAPAQFFEYWTSFTSDFNDIFKKELLILTNELLKKTRQVTKPQSKPTSGENNLKARINRLKNRNN